MTDTSAIPATLGRYEIRGVLGSGAMATVLDGWDAAIGRRVAIKPGNIYLLEDGTVKVADFGIAHLESSNLTQAGLILGTPSYMSPEQFTGQPIDGRSDLFSAGVILYQFLTGERPFAGNSTG